MWREEYFTCLWMASKSGVEGGSCLTAHGNTLQQLGQEVKKAALRWNCWSGTEVKRMPYLQGKFSLLPWRNVLYHRGPFGRAGGGFLRRRVLFKAMVQCRYWCTGQCKGKRISVQRTPPSLCFRTVCLVVTWDCWVGDQGADDNDCLGDRLYTFASVRNSDNKGVCSQGTRYTFLFRLPFCWHIRPHHCPSVWLLSLCSFDWGQNGFFFYDIFILGQE